MTADLHTHTTASDGEYTPPELVALAAAQGITTLAITDHDTTDGIRPALAAAARHGITLIPGIEISAETNADGSVHMLGYFIDTTDATFQAWLASFRENRYDRGRAIIRQLNTLGVPLTFEAVAAVAGDAPITRPHIGRALVAAGHVADLQTAFDRYLADDAPAYVPRAKMTPEEAVDVIHAAGGVAVMAHPGRVDGWEPLLLRLAAHGVDGVELHHPANPPALVARAAQLATAHDLITTGGSDFHRDNPDGSVALGSVHPPDGAVERLRARAGAH